MKFESSFSSAVYLKPQPASWKIVGANTKGIPLPIVDRLNLDLVWVRDIGGWMPNTMDARLTGALLQRSVSGWVPVKPVDLPILASYSLPQSNDKSEAPLSRELVIDGHGMPVQQNHLSEPEGQFMRLLLDQESEVMRIWTSLPAMDAERWITLEANLRVPGGGTIHANIHDNIDTVRHRSTVIQFEAPADTWIKVSLRHLKDVKSESDNFGIGLVKPRSGAMLDIKDIVIFAGINY
ncbi:hypothetical protein N826_13795 [Skermanella aerolata KACC 11604]|nr:hypothetical protein [Skermanella aerolata]KJB89857.1 hypothetical protein N826_13795 [Skermanella aerolata KACC 11604]